MADMKPGGGNKRSPRYEANNQGGYGNPPVRNQFKPGNPGGPGRKRGSTSLDNALKKMFRSKVAITRNGNPAKIDMMEAMAERAKKEILSGNYKALELGFKLGTKFGPVEIKQDSRGFDITKMTPVQRYAFRKFVITMPGIDESGLRQVQFEMELERKQRKEAAKKRRQERNAKAKIDDEKRELTDQSETVQDSKKKPKP